MHTNNKLNKTNRLPAEKLPPGSEAEVQIAADQLKGMNWFLILIITMAMIPWILGRYELFGFKITGWSWVISIVVAGSVCIGNIGKIAFPFRLWLSWICILSLYWFFGRYNPGALQSFVQMLTPLVVGCAASVFRPGKLKLEIIVLWITRLAWVVWILLLIRVPMILTGMLPSGSFMAAEVIGILLLGACYASFYACGSSRHLFYYLSVLGITLISLVRGPIVAMFSCLPLTLAPMKISKRVILCVGLIICALIIFNSDRMQQRMFFSGVGGLNDLYLGNPNLVTSGRSVMWNILWDGVEREPWFGNGWNFHRVTLPLSGIPTYLPHNDWLKLLYDIGLMGASLYLFTMILQTFNLVGIARQSTGAHQMLAYGVATAFIPYAIIMLTDNVVLYVQYLGNLHFAIIGIVYGALQRHKKYRAQHL